MKGNLVTVLRNVCRIVTTEILARHVCSFGPFPNAENDHMLPRKEEMVTTLFSKMAEGRLASSDEIVVDQLKLNAKNKNTT